MEFCDEFICSINKNHILNDPKELPCGASACFSCIQKTLSKRYKNQIMRCKACSKIHYISNVFSMPVNHTFELMLIDSFQYINKEVYEKLEKLVEVTKGEKF